MPKLTNKGLARKALKTIEPKASEPITGPNQPTKDVHEGTDENVKLAKIEQSSSEDARLSRIEQEIVKAEKLLSLSNRAEEVESESSSKVNRFGVITGQRRDVDITEVHKTSIDKHVESMRYKIAWVANKLADELIHETSKKTKKDKEYIKGLVWSFGTMYDKLANISTDTVQVHIPTKLLEGVKSAISLQISRVQAAHQDQLKNITPDPVSIQIARVQQAAQAQAQAQAQAPLSSFPQGVSSTTHPVGEILDVQPTNVQDTSESTPT